MKTYQKQLSKVQRFFSENLLSWFASHKRVLPWRTKRTPYRVWVAEIMLQQTRVDQVQPYYQRFMKRFPSLRSLAEADRREVLKMWEGLGYYGRARRMHDTARLITSDHAGRFPKNYEGLLLLPGIGPYTAAAIASLAMNEDVAVLDGNVARVLARVFAVDTPVDKGQTKKLLQGLVDQLLPKGKSGQFNEAMMELGALCCLPKNPSCDQCPLARACRARAMGRMDDFPKKAPKKRIPHKVVGAGVIVNKGRVLLAQRRENDMLGGLWEFPGGTREEGETIEECIARELKEELGITVEVGKHVTTVNHAYSHFTMELHAYLVRIRQGSPRAIECADHKWTTRRDIRSYAMSRADIQILDVVEGLKVLR